MNKLVRVQLNNLADYCKKHNIPDTAVIVGEPGDLRLVVPTNGKVADDAKVADVQLPPWRVAELPVEVTE